jgi:hypothetical protein
MFAKGSRYRNLPQSANVDAQGEILVGTTLRLIAENPGQFLHTVRDRDRLDLLGYKYYSDATRWWQVCDANPQAEFPNDLLDRSPLADAVLLVVQGDAVTRYTALLTALAALGQVTAPAAGLPGDFVACPIIVNYSVPAHRVAIVAAIAANGFHLLRSFAWPDAANTAEQFIVEDRAVKQGWQDMTRSLRAIPGIRYIVADMGTSTIQVTYNTALVSLTTIQTNIAQHGFSAPPALAQVLDRIGSRIVVPPNGVV